MAEQLTKLLGSMQEGDKQALDHAIALVYEELRVIARNQLNRSRDGHVLQPTALVHEVFEKLHDADITPRNRSHFLGICAMAMRQILVDDARRCNSLKGKAQLTQIKTNLVGASSHHFDVLVINELMKKLETFDERKCRLAELIYFGGMTQAEAAEYLKISERTVRREMLITKAWILSEIADA